MEDSEYFNENLALSELLVDGVLFSNTRRYVCPFEGEDPENSTIVLFVLCNDLFYWASADGECIRCDEIELLYKMHKADKVWGSSKWCCKRRGLKPQVPIQVDMKKDGAWEDWMDDLEDPSPS
ncbi:MAG: hypothetical protein ABIH23_10105 [bacterium]